jgi:hypothetical protein
LGGLEAQLHGCSRACKLSRALCARQCSRGLRTGRSDRNNSHRGRRGYVRAGRSRAGTPAGTRTGTGTRSPPRTERGRCVRIGGRGAFSAVCSCGETKACRLSCGAVCEGTSDYVNDAIQTASDTGPASSDLRDEHFGDVFELVDDGTVFDGVEELEGVIDDGFGALDEIGRNREGDADKAGDAVGDLAREVLDQGRDLTRFNLGEETIGFVFIILEDFNDFAGDLVEEADDTPGAEKAPDQVSRLNQKRALRYF